MTETTHLRSVDEVIERLGGTVAVREMTAVRTNQAVWEWRNRGVIASKFYVMMTEALAAQGCTAESELWGQKGAGDPQRPGKGDADRIPA